VRALPRGLSAAVWDEAQRLRTSQRLVPDKMGAPEGVVSVAAAGVPNQGHAAVGVARQDGEPLGQVDHGQVGVCAAAASRQG